MGFDWELAPYHCHCKQSPDIAIVSIAKAKRTRCCDRFNVLVTPSRETDVFMPAPLLMPTASMRRQAELRKQDIFPWLRTRRQKVS